ncbi:10212_t:CDS:2 [Ambispora gerdemannii]|uniref:10212_t:CDS:1 n=1 Tax=Ambispora gerdemannii TaxID=144530 RepID=A0A9N9FEW6_9GLOM|nr:10212_t:CDS:2 [Ambispora gerdemannii]
MNTIKRKVVMITNYSVEAKSETSPNSSLCFFQLIDTDSYDTFFDEYRILDDFDSFTNRGHNYTLHNFPEAYDKDLVQAEKDLDEEKFENKEKAIDDKIEARIKELRTTELSVII